LLYTLTGAFCFAPSRIIRVSGYLARTQSPDKSGRDWAGGARFTFSGRRYTYGANYREVQPNFNPEVGYLSRTDIRLISGNFAWLFHPEDTLGILEISPNVKADNYYTTKNRLDTRILTSGINVTFRNNSSLSLSQVYTHEDLDRPFKAFRAMIIPVGDYRYNVYKASYTGNNSWAVSPTFNFEKGEYYDGNRTLWGGGINLRPIPKFILIMNVTRNNVSLPTGSFGTNLMNWQLQYAFSTKMFLNALIQYNSTTGQISSNIRYNFIHHPLSDLFVVYNENRDQRTGDLMDRVIAVKFTQLFDF
jgi:hypothetical protein